MDGVAPALRAGWLYFLRANGSSCPREWLSRDAFYTDRVSANFGQFLRHLNMPHMRFHDLRHTAATNMHQLTGDFFSVGEILGHTLKGIGISLGISTNLEAVTDRYIDVRLERKHEVLQKYHGEIFTNTEKSKKENAVPPSKRTRAPQKER